MTDTKQTARTGARVVVVGSQKGGVGKTTLSVGIAGAWAEMDKRVLFVDADPQRSASEQLRGHGKIKLAQHTGGGLDELLPEVAGEYDLVIVDTPSGVNDALASALRVADLLMIPVKPSPYDFMSAETTLAVARAAGVRTVFVVNEADKRMSFSKQAAEALAHYGVRVLRTAVTYRSAHRIVVTMGQPVTDVLVNGGKAAGEIRALAREILLEVQK